MLHAVELHMTMGKKHKPSHHDLQQCGQLDRPQETILDADADTHDPKGTDNCQAMADGPAATPGPGATEATTHPHTTS